MLRSGAFAAFALLAGIAGMLLWRRNANAETPPAGGSMPANTLATDPNTAAPRGQGSYIGTAVHLARDLQLHATESELLGGAVGSVFPAGDSFRIQRAGTYAGYGSRDYFGTMMSNGQLGWALLTDAEVAAHNAS